MYNVLYLQEYSYKNKHSIHLIWEW